MHEWAAQIKGRVLIVGVGNELRGDDAVGLEVARLLQNAQCCDVLIAEDVPENYLGPILGENVDRRVTSSLPPSARAYSEGCQYNVLSADAVECAATDDFGGQADNTCKHGARKTTTTPPDTVIFCDAVDMGAEPGSFALMDVEQLRGASVSTHNPSLRLLGRCLRDGGVKQVLIAGIQPLRIAWGEGISPAVQEAARTVAALLAEVCGGSLIRDKGARSCPGA